MTQTNLSYDTFEKVLIVLHVQLCQSQRNVNVLEFSQSSQGPHRREYFSKQTTRCRMVVYNKRSQKKPWPLKSVIARQFF